MSGILVFGERNEDGSLASITGELVAAGKSLGDEVAVAVLGTNSGDASGEAIARGADRVYQVQDALLDESA